MYKPLAMEIALRYLTFKAQESSIAFMVRICFLGIFIGTSALMITLIIMQGFEKTIHEKMKGINSDIIITAPDEMLDADLIKKHVRQTFPNSVHGISGSSIRQVIIEHNNRQSVIFLKGVNPEDEQTVSSIADKITLSTDNFINLLQHDELIVGYKVAQDHALSLHDALHLLIPESQGKHNLSLRKKHAHVAGFFKIGLEEYDHHFAYCNLNFFNKIFEIEQGVECIAVSLTKDAAYKLLHSQHNPLKKDFWKACWYKVSSWLPFISYDSYTPLLTALKQELPDCTVNSWKELHPALVASLKLEKYVMFFILALITLVACMNMVSLLFMQIQHKRTDIAILKSMGMPRRIIKHIFLYLGMLITTTASSLGLLLAFVVGAFLKKYPFIELPDVYYVSHLPAHMEFSLFMVVFFVTMLIGFVATWIPAQRAQKINITEVLRQD